MLFRSSEAYVVTKSVRGYRRLYRRHPNRLLATFWAGMAGLALLGTVFSEWKACQHR